MAEAVDIVCSKNGLVIPSVPSASHGCLLVEGLSPAAFDSHGREVRLLDS